jgi:hypothetical protein
MAGSSLARVTTGRGPRLSACRAVLLAFGGVWLGHVIEHFRVEGSAGLAHELSHSVHLYMLPLGAVLVALAALTGVGWVRMGAALRRRLGHASDGLTSVFRGGPARAHPTMPASPTGPSVSGRWLALAMPLGVAQLVLYGLQENLEHAFAGEDAPLLSVFAGAHWAASLVQLGVACVLAVLVIACRRRVADLARRIDAFERLAHWLTRARVVVLPAPPVGRMRSFTPLERFGRHLLQRPPPPLRISH